MNLATLAKLIETTLRGDSVPESVTDLCIDYYAPYYTLFYLVSQWLGRGLAVELGVEKARGSGSLAAGSSTLTVVGIDHTKRPEVDKVQSKYPNFIFLEQPSLPVPDPLRDLHRKIDILHIDTEHSYAMAQEEFKAYQSVLADGAIVFFDDIHAQNDGVLKYVCTLPYPKIFDDRLHEGTGFGMILYV